MPPQTDSKFLEKKGKGGVRWRLCHQLRRSHTKEEKKRGELEPTHLFSQKKSDLLKFSARYGRKREGGGLSPEVKKGGNLEHQVRSARAFFRKRPSKKKKEKTYLAAPTMIGGKKRKKRIWLRARLGK